MPSYEHEMPAGVQDILDRMPRELRQRVLADYDSHYAPFLAMLTGWKGAVQEHYARGEASALARLEEQFFPLGHWNFPAQTLAAPQRPPARTTEIGFGAPFNDPTGRPWTAAGAGWLHPTSLREAGFVWEGDDCLCVLDVENEGATPLDLLLARGQLAFVAAPDAVVTALADADWWVLLPGQRPQRAQAERYDGYMAFERELHVIRMNQRQFDLWLPPCYPYARKMLRLRADGTGDEPPPLFLDFQRDVRAGFRLVGHLRGLSGRGEAQVREAAGQRDQPLFWLNAVPLVQTAVTDSVFFPPFPRLGHEYALRLNGVPNVLAAIAYNDGVAVPTALFRVPAADPQAREPDVEARFAPAQTNVARLKVYHGSAGGLGPDPAATPSLLERAPLRYVVPFRAVGGLSTGAPVDRASWARQGWYHSVLRPPLLTEGDLWEILAPHSARLGDPMRLRGVLRSVAQEPACGGLHWRSYLWPTLAPRQDDFAARYGALPTDDYEPLIQTLGLTFERAAGAVGTPAFLLADFADYFASLTAQYFTLSCVHVEGHVRTVP